MSLIRVDKITGKSGTDGGAPITFSGDNVTIDQPGSVINSGVKTFSGGDHTTTSASIEAVLDYQQISCTIGNTIMFFYSGTAYSDRTSNANATAYRVGHLYSYQSTSAVSQGATSSLGTQLIKYLNGIEFQSSSIDSAGPYIPFNSIGVFEATSTTHYCGLCFRSSITQASFKVFMQSDIKLIFNYYEIQGDVLT